MYIYLLIFIPLACSLATSQDQSYDSYQYSTTKEENITEDDVKPAETSKVSPTATSYSSLVIHAPPQHTANTRSSDGEMTGSSEHRPSLKIHYKRPLPNYDNDYPKPSYRPSYLQSPSMSHVANVHPAVMQKLLKQQPQTFDYQNDNTESEEALNYEYNNRETPTDYRSLKDQSEEFSRGFDRDNEQRSHKFRYYRFGGRNNDKGLRYSSNHDKPSSFKVGYSIGFGSNGHMRPHNMHNVPTSFHMEGKNTVWKQLGPGVEMSEQVGQNRFPFKFGNGKQNIPEQSNQAIYYLKSADNMDSSLTSGRMTFDHEHALGQSNSFDFTNAIDPSSGNHIALSNDQRQYASNYRNQEVEDTMRDAKYTHATLPQSSYTQSKLSSFNPFPTNSNNPNPKKVAAFPLGQNIYAGNFGYSSYPLIQQMYIPSKNGNGQMIPALLIPITQGPPNPQGGPVFMRYNNFGGPQLPYFGMQGMQEPVALSSMRNQNSFPRPPFYQQSVIIPSGQNQLGPQIPNPIALPLLMTPNHSPLHRYQRDSNTETSTMMKSDDMMYYKSPQDQKSLNYKSPSSSPAVLHIIKTSRPTRDLSHNPIISTILDKVYSTSPRTYAGATIILKET